MKPQIRKLQADASKSESLEEIVWREVKVRCQITFQGKYIGVKTEDFTDYFLARSVLKGRVTLPIARAVV